MDAQARSVFDQLREHKDAELLARLEPSIRENAASQLPAIEKFIPPGDPRGRLVVGTNTLSMPGGDETVTTVDEYDYGDHTVQTTVRLLRSAAHPAWQVQGFHLQSATSAELATLRFNLSHKSLPQYLFLIFVVASPLLMIAALIKVLRTPGLKWKWLWAVAAFLGLFAFQMNWATGQLTYQLISVQWIGAGVLRGIGAFSPWILSATVPVGALLILTGIWANPRRSQKPRRAAPPASVG